MPGADYRSAKVLPIAVSMSRLLLSLAFLPFLGCHSPEVHPEGAEVIITETHLHTRYCGHYFYEGHWYYLPLHRHGVGCDHELVDGIWTLQD
jgi:hypothetical protein